MSIQLEDLEYQREAIDAVVDVLDGQIRNTFDNSNLFGIHANTSSLTPEQVEANKKAVLAKTGVSEADAALTPEQDICIEMETGTGKTLVYFRTVYELHKRYGLTKFIVLVPPSPSRKARFPPSRISASSWATATASPRPVLNTTAPSSRVCARSSRTPTRKSW